MRIALINPVARGTRGYQHTSYIPPLGLQVLSQLTPQGHQVELIDEVFGGEQTETLLREGGYDLVGITAYSSGATRAYELAALCRRLGIACIMGGPHAWAVPDEAQPHFDSVAVGECDELWPGIINDAAAGNLQKHYVGRHVDLQHGYGAADQTLQAINGKYDVSCIQMSRGCPVGCDYCSVTRFNGAKIRRRSIDQIITEWNSTDRKFVFVVDDNFFGVGKEHAEWAKQLLREIIKRGKKRIWFSQTSINMGADPEGLRLAYKAGCRAMLVGFESFNAENLKECHKGINQRFLDRYREMVASFHRYGMAVFGAFIIGAEHDTEDTVADTVLQAVKLGVDILQITNLTPLPGTKMYQRYLDEGRIFATNYPRDWERYTFIETVYHPRKMSAQQLDQTIYELRQGAATENWVWKRTLKTLWRTRSLSTAVFVHSMNSQFAGLARSLTSRDSQRFTSPTPLCPRMAKIRRSMALWPGA